MERIVEQFLSLLLLAWFGSVPPAQDLQDPTRPPEPILGCAARLEAAGVRFEETPLPLHESSGGHLCGAPQVLRYRRGPGELRWSSSPKVSCATALALARFEPIVQEEAERLLRQRVRRIKHLGTYNCREMAAYEGWVSEHSYANAIDIASFELRDGSQISIAEHWHDEGARGEFLRSVARRLYDEDVFAGVLTPDFDRHHRGHMHLDMAHYRSRGVNP